MNVICHLSQRGGGGALLPAAERFRKETWSPRPDSQSGSASPPLGVRDLERGILAPGLALRICKAGALSLSYLFCEVTKKSSFVTCKRPPGISANRCGTKSKLERAAPCERTRELGLGLGPPGLGPSVPLACGQVSPGPVAERPRGLPARTRRPMEQRTHETVWDQLLGHRRCIRSIMLKRERALRAEVPLHM